MGIDFNQPGVDHIRSPRIAGGAELDCVVVDISLFVGGKGAGDESVGGIDRHRRKGIEVAIGFSAAGINLPDRASGTGDIQMSMGKSWMEYRLPADEARESLGEIGCVGRGRPIGVESPDIHGQTIHPVVAGYIPSQLVPGIRAAIGAELPTAEGMAGDVMARLADHVEAVAVNESRLIVSA